MTEHQKRPAFEPPSRLLQPTDYEPAMKRPASIVAGSGLVLLRVIAGVLWAIGISRGEHNAFVDVIVADGSTAVEDAFIPFVLVFSGIVLLFDTVFAVLIFFGRNWARVVVMFLSMFAIVGAFVGWWERTQSITLTSGTSIVAVGLDILILLALSSRSAARYARRNERR